MISGPVEPVHELIDRLAQKVRSLREAAGLTQQEVANRSGTSRSAIARLERGSALPSISTLAGIAAALGVDLVLDLNDPKEAIDTARPVARSGRERIKVVVADSQHLFAQTLAAALAGFDDFEVHYVKPKAGLTTGLEAAEAVARTKPGVALLDYWMAEMDGSALTRASLAWSPESKVLLLSWFHSPRDVQEALEAGAHGFLPKTSTIDEVGEAIRRAFAGEPLVYATQLHSIVDLVGRREEQSKQIWERLADLTPREIDVLRMVSSGRPLKDIAKDMSISQGTLRIHLNNIMSKTGAATRMEAVALARAVGLIRS